MGIFVHLVPFSFLVQFCYVIIYVWLRFVSFSFESNLYVFT